VNAEEQICRILWTQGFLPQVGKKKNEFPSLCRPIRRRKDRNSFGPEATATNGRSVPSLTVRARRSFWPLADFGSVKISRPLTGIRKRSRGNLESNNGAWEKARAEPVRLQGPYE
jgi:hypothetical protein